MSFRKYIILWEYFWYFEWKKQKTSQNSPISTIFFIIKISKIEFFQKGLLKIFTLNWFLILQYTLILGIYSKGLTDSVQPVHPLRINVRIDSEALNDDAMTSKTLGGYVTNFLDCCGKK